MAQRPATITWDQLTHVRREYPRVTRLTDLELVRLLAERPDLFEKVACTHGDH